MESAGTGVAGCVVDGVERVDRANEVKGVNGVNGVGGLDAAFHAGAELAAPAQRASSSASNARCCAALVWRCATLARSFICAMRSSANAPITPTTITVTANSSRAVPRAPVRVGQVNRRRAGMAAKVAGAKSNGNGGSTRMP